MIHFQRLSYAVSTADALCYAQNKREIMKIKIIILSILFLFPLAVFSQQIATDKDSLKIFDGETLLVYNIGTNDLIIDTLYSVNPIYGYLLDIETKDTTFEYYSVSEVISPTPMNLVLEQNDTAEFVFKWVDLCIICKKNSPFEYFTDTLKLISNSIQKDTLILFVEGDGVLSSVNERYLPAKLELYQNYPNPFNPITDISFSLPNDGYITLRVYDNLGRIIKELAKGFRKKGIYKIKFNAEGIPSNIYFYQLRVDDKYLINKKMVLIK